MSTDAIYILDYTILGYISPTPMEKDIEYLEKKYGGAVNYIDCCTICWHKPKYTLLPEEYENLLADRVLEKRDCELFEVVK